MSSDTRERILDKSLEMFSEYGYDGTSLRELAKSLGISKSAIYRHFPSKEAICDTLMERLVNYYEDKMNTAEGLYTLPMTDEQFIELVMRLVIYTINDRTVIMTRKLIASETFRRDRSTHEATKRLQVGMEGMFTEMFRKMMEIGYLKKDDPQMLGFSFVAPITSLIHLIIKDESYEVTLLDYIRKFTEHFLKTYKA